MLLLVLETALTPSGQRDPPLNRRPALTVGELITAYSSPWPSLLSPYNTLPRLARECTAYNRNQVWFKKKKRRRRKLPKCIYVQCAHVLLPSLTEGSQESPCRRRKIIHQVNGWSKLKDTCFCAGGLPVCQSGECASSGSESEGWGGVRCGLQTGKWKSRLHHHFSKCCQALVIFEPCRSPFPLHRWEYQSSGRRRHVS